MGYFVGHRKYVKSPQEKALDEAIWEHKRKAERDAWHSKWITVWRLKKDRLWTDGAIAKWLDKPKKQGKYNVFLVEDVRKAERKKAFKEWLAPRLAKKVAENEFFQINKI